MDEAPLPVASPSAARIEKLEALAAVVPRLVLHLSRLIDPGGREWNDYLVLLDAVQALKVDGHEARKVAVDKARAAAEEGQSQDRGPGR